MSNTSDKPKIPDLMEAVFDTGYSEKLLYIWKRTIKEYEQWNHGRPGKTGIGRVPVLHSKWRSARQSHALPGQDRNTVGKDGRRIGGIFFQHQQMPGAFKDRQVNTAVLAGLLPKLDYWKEYDELSDNGQFE